MHMWIATGNIRNMSIERVECGNIQRTKANSIFTLPSLAPKGWEDLHKIERVCLIQRKFLMLVTCKTIAWFSHHSYIKLFRECLANIMLQLSFCSYEEETTLEQTMFPGIKIRSIPEID